MKLFFLPHPPLFFRLFGIAVLCLTAFPLTDLHADTPDDLAPLVNKLRTRMNDLNTPYSVAFLPSGKALAVIRGVDKPKAFSSSNRVIPLTSLLPEAQSDLCPECTNSREDYWEGSTYVVCGKACGSPPSAQQRRLIRQKLNALSNLNQLK